ncbi:MAG: sporulation protein YqfD [Clostridia bacterium]|nr:sporulation protein YqfD [Clostridia bacterium]
MLLLRLWNYIRGYVIILVEGFFLEKFINICIHRQIFLWDIKKLKNSTMRLKVSIPGFKLLRPVAKKTLCRVRIVRKKGLPFIMNRYKKRKAFVAGAFFFIALLYTLTSFVWTVEISGNKSLETEFILDKLASMGIKPGILKFGIDTESAASSLMLDIKELAWVGISVKGTKVRVEVAERKQPPEIVAKHIPCDIVALRDGIIKSIVVKAGQEKVKVGESVTKGQLLVSGAVETKNDQINTRLVHAIASIKARTWYEVRRRVESKAVMKERTGEKKDFYSLMLFTKRFDFFHGEAPYENFEKIEIKKRLSLGGDIELPFELITDRYYEVRLVEKELEIEEAKQSAMEEAYGEAVAAIPENAQIVSTGRNFIEDGQGGIDASVIIECIEEIGVAKEIGGK